MIVDVMHKSPHSKKRPPVQIKIIVIHATVSDNMESCLNWFANPKSGVSSHYVVGRDGKIASCVDESLEAFHAGKSELKGMRNLNKNSIGIELVNLNDGKQEYTKIQIQRLAELCLDLLKRYPSIEYIVGHDDIAPKRKTDPGVKFPWNLLKTLVPGKYYVR